MKKIINVLFVCVIAMGVLSITGCASTWDGVGKDIEQMGKTIQGSGEENKDSEKT